MVLACSHSRSLQLLARLDARTEFKILEHSLEGGVEAGRAHHCMKLEMVGISIYGSLRGVARFPVSCVNYCAHTPQLLLAHPPETGLDPPTSS